MLYTNTLGLKKPQDTDKVNQEDFNYNSDVIDASVKRSQQFEHIVDILIKGSPIVTENGDNIGDGNGNILII